MFVKFRILSDIFLRVVQKIDIFEKVKCLKFCISEERDELTKSHTVSFKFEQITFLVCFKQFES